MANGNMAGIGKTNLLQPVTDVAQKAAKAGQVKSIKLKIKMKGKNDGSTKRSVPSNG